MDATYVGWILLTLFALFGSDLWQYHFTEALRCNYCFNADLKEDCMYSSQECKQGQVCAIDSTNLTYIIGAKRDTEKTVWQYKMGCTATITCRDGVSYGPGPYGYAKTYRKCCCSDLCIEPDGVGLGNFQDCENALDNVTSSATSYRKSPAFHQGYLGALLSGLYFVHLSWSLNILFLTKNKNSKKKTKKTCESCVEKRILKGNSYKCDQLCTSNSAKRKNQHSRWLKSLPSAVLNLEASRESTQTRCSQRNRLGNR